MKDISLDAFANTSELHHLDLSHTSIDRLPVKGLKKIQQLTLKDVPRLKHLPSVLAFNNLVKAEFTYAAHCCFFKYATREYKKSSQYQDHYQEIQHRICRRQQQNSKFNFFKPSPRFERDIERFQRNPTGYPLSRKSWTTSKQAEDSEESDLFEDLAKWYKKLDFGALKIPDNLLNTSSSSSEAEQDSEEQPAYTGDKLGQSVILKKCDETAVDDFYLNITCTPQPDALNPCEDIVSYKPLRVVIWVMWIIAIVGNVAVWVVIITVWQRRMRLHYFFMLNLSFADFLTGVYLAILAVADLKTSNEYYNYAVNWQTGWGCSAAGFISVFASELSVFSMLMIAGEIYYNAKYAFFGKRMTTKAACLFMSLGYFYAFSMASLPLMGVSSYQRSSICLPLSINSITDRVYIMIGLSLSAAAFASMVFNYIMINCMIRNPDGPSREEDRQILLKTLVLIGTDMICWVPTLFLGLTAAMGLPLITLTNAKVCLILVYPINSCANPLLYVFLTKIWKDAKLKAAPILELISRQYDKRNSVSMNRFYYSAGPGEQDECASSVKSSPKLTSCVSSPLIKQGKLCLTVNKSAHNLLNTSSIRSNEEATDQKRLSRVSFQDSVLFAVPEMSDISETSSNSANADKDEANIDQANKMSTSSKRSSQLFQPIINMDKRNSSTSIGKDSGRGDSCCSSLTSNGLLMNRPSVVTMDWEGPVVRHINTPTFLVTD
uniref:G-protein coupled receptors family 1 profile domain-containing protein n=1 Tax=Ditylenchus dipsaci TaxID=166011 RepID=A0A915CNA5_9BILA